MPIFNDPPALQGAWHSPCGQNPTRAPNTPAIESCVVDEGESGDNSPIVLWDDRVAYAPSDEEDRPRVLWDGSEAYDPSQWRPISPIIPSRKGSIDSSPGSAYRVVKNI